MIKKGKLAVHLRDVVTGTMEGSKGDQTPRGVWYIHYKESPSTLRGTNDDDPISRKRVSGFGSTNEKKGD